jgi:hypothetical protein
MSDSDAGGERRSASAGSSVLVRGFVLIAFLCIAAGAFQPHYWRMFTINRKAAGAWLVELPYSHMPGLRRFMTAVRDRTRGGDRIAIIIPAPAWESGYQYGFTRSTYLLAGRTTVPLMGSDDRRLPRNVQLANYVACWHASPRIDGFATVWRSADGVLLGRIDRPGLPLPAADRQ